MNQKLDTKLSQLKSLEDKINQLSDEKEQLRTEVFSLLESETDGQYKNDIATASYVERKSVKYKDAGDTLNKLVEMNLPKYFDVVPEHKEINKKFETDIKNGAFTIDGVEVDVKKLPQIRFV